MLKRNGDGKAHIDRIELYNTAIKTVAMLISLFVLYLAVTGSIETKIDKETGELDVQIETVQTSLNENIKLDAADHATLKAGVAANKDDIERIERTIP